MATLLWLITMYDTFVQSYYLHCIIPVFIACFIIGIYINRHSPRKLHENRHFPFICIAFLMLSLVWPIVLIAAVPMATFYLLGPIALKILKAFSQLMYKVFDGNLHPPFLKNIFRSKWKNFRLKSHYKS